MYAGKCGTLLTLDWNNHKNCATGNHNSATIMEHSQENCKDGGKESIQESSSMKNEMDTKNHIKEWQICMHTMHNRSQDRF